MEAALGSVQVTRRQVRLGPALEQQFPLAATLLQVVRERQAKLHDPVVEKRYPTLQCKPHQHPVGTHRKFKRLCTPKAGSGQEVSEGQRAGQGGTASGADISGVLERAWAGRWGRVQARRAGVRSGAAAPAVAGDGGYPETRWSNAKPGSRWAMRSQCGVGSGSSSQPGGPRAGAIGGGSVGSPIWARRRCTGAASATLRDDAPVCAAVGADQRQGHEQPRLLPFRQQGPEIARRRSHVAQRSSGRWVRLGGGAQVVSGIAPEGDGRCT